MSTALNKFWVIKNRLFQGFNSFIQLKHVHACLLRLGLDQDNYLLNLFLRRSFDFGDIRYTKLVFYQTREPNVYLWNTMIRGLVSHDCFADALQLYGSMRGMGFLPNNFTLPFVLKACARISNFQLGVGIHNVVLKAGFDCDEYVLTSLVCFYGNCGHVESALKASEDIPNINIVCWNAIISGYINLGRFREAIDVFGRLVEMGLRSDSYTLVQVVGAYSELGNLRSREWIHRYITEIGMDTNVFVTTALLDMYVKCGDMEKARQTFDSMPEKGIVSWNTMIQGYAFNGLPNEALELFFEMLHGNLKPDCYTMVGVLYACARLGSLELGSWASSLMDESEFLSNPVLGTALIDMYGKCGSMTQAWKVFKRMKEKDCAVWNAVISELAMNGQVKIAFAVFGQLEKSGTQPDGNTFVGLLSGCTHAGLVDEGRRCFNNINHVYHLTPTVEHYGCMADLLSRAGSLDEAHRLIKSMPVKANAIVWGALLSGCRLHQDFELAEYVLKQLIEIEPLNSGNYILLSNIYLATQRWDEAAKIRASMSALSVQKIKGRSWIELGGVVHQFLVEDESHPLTQRIYANLHALTEELKTATGQDEHALANH